MTWWWEKPGASSEAAPEPSQRRRSIWESYYAAEAAATPAEHWEPVGEIEPVTGRFDVARADWTRRVGGWRPIHEWLDEGAGPWRGPGG